MVAVTTYRYSVLYFFQNWKLESQVEVVSCTYLMTCDGAAAASQASKVVVSVSEKWKIFPMEYVVTPLL